MNNLKNFYVATSGSCRDINTELEAVATAACKEIKVATSSAQEKEVATSLSCRDISCKDQKVVTTSSDHDIKYKELRSRHQSDVATSVVKKRGRDMIKLSRH